MRRLSFRLLLSSVVVIRNEATNLPVWNRCTWLTKSWSLIRVAATTWWLEVLPE